MKGQAPGTLDAPNFAALQTRLKADKDSVTLTVGQPADTVTIQNGLPGPVDLAVDVHVASIKGISVQIDKQHLNAGEKAKVRIERVGNAKFSDEVAIRASQLNIVLSIQVESK